MKLLAALLLAVVVSAQEIDTTALDALRYRLIGSFRAGRVTAVAGVSGQPNVYYFGTPGGGIWKTTDAGHVWFPIFDKARVASIGALTVAPSNPAILYAGTGEQTPGNGIWKSSDAGATWTHSGLDSTRFLQQILVDPRNPNIVVAGANSMGQALLWRPVPKRTFTTDRGIFKSTDGGHSWKKTLADDETAGVVDLCADPDNPRIIFASLFVPAAGPREGGTKADSRLYKSTDQGSTWRPLIAKGLPEKDRGRVGIAVASGTRGRRLYLIADQGLYRSDDGGANWTQPTKDPRVVGSAYFSRVFPDTQNPDILYVAQTSLYRSTDGGHSFTAYVGAPSGDDFHVLWIDLQDGARMLLGVDQGAILSVDAGKTWSSWYNQPTGQFYHVTTDNAFPYRTYAAQQDSGTQSVPSRGDNGQITPADVTSVGGFEFCFIAPDPLHPDWIYSGGWYGSVVRYDRRSGQTATVFEKGDRYRAANMPPLFFSPHDPHTLFAGMQSVLKTSDEGKTWQDVSPDLTEWTGSEDETAKNPDLPKPPAINALAPSPLDAGRLWAATTNHLVQLTTDGGAHWHKVTPAGLAAPSQILYVEPSHHDAATAYLTVGSSREVVPAQVFRTRDSGKNWDSIINGLPSNESVRVVREDPVRPGLLFAGTDSTVFVSFDQGGHWHPLTLNLPASPVTDIAFHGDDLVLSTYGRGLWILDNITPIRELTPAVLTSAVYLFSPGKAVRMRWDTYQDTPLPVETPTGKNPPDGVILDYYLKSSVAGEPSLTIRDAKGAVVRRFTSTAGEPELPLPNVPDYWFGKPQSVARTPGLHRFVWDLRQESPKVLPYSYYGGILDYTEYTLADHAIPYDTPRQQPQGAYVLPGNYTIELTAGGETVRQPLKVTLDPRVHASSADLEAQRDLEQQILSALTLTYDEYQKVKTLSAALAERQKAQKLEAAELEKKIQAVLEGSKAAPGFGPIHRDLVRLFTGTNSSDQRPTEPQQAAVDQKCQAIEAALQRWQELNEKDLPAFNETLRQKSLAALPPVREVQKGCHLRPAATQ